MDEDQRFLDGVTVVDLTRLLPGPFATLLLAEMGADVIKVEDPDRGDYARFYPPMAGSSSAYYQSLNRNKRGLTLDLKADRGLEVMKRLLGEADVLVESFRPGVLARLGLEIDELREEFPELIVCSVTGYGQTGPYSDRAGHDANYLALSGLLGRNRDDDGQPRIPGFQIADLGGGALYAALGITSALYRREQTDRGAHLDISMTEGAVSFLSTTVARRDAGGDTTPGEGMLDGGLPCYRIYPTADDRYLAVAALEPKFWDPFVEAIGAEDLVGRGMQRGEQGREVAARLAEIIEGESLEHWREVLEGLDVCVEPVLQLEEVVDHPLFEAREMFFELQGLRQMRTPLTPADFEHSPAPDQGEHSEEILAEVGVDPGELEELRDDGVI